MLSPKTFKFALTNAGVGEITLARPDRLNALTFGVYEELRDFFLALDHETSVRSILIMGEGRGFCSGGDVEDIIGQLFQRDMQGMLAFTRVTGALIRNIRAVRKPVVAAIHGACVGAGAVIAAACDFRIAGERAKFGFIFPKVGLSGADMGASYLLPRLIGGARASELLFLGDVIDAKEAYRIGLVNRLVSTEECVPVSRALAERLASGPAFAHGVTKQMLESEATMSLDQAIEAEAQAQAMCMMHTDFRTAHEAWNAKKPAMFAGSSIPFKSDPS